MQPIVSIKNLCKTYQSGHEALKNISLDIEAGEIIALLGPNGAGKTTLISAICGIVSTTSGSVTVDGFDTVKDYRKTRSLIGLVPQELTLGAFEKVANTLAFSRGLFGKKPNPEYLETLLKQLSLWDKKDSALMMLSGGMKRRVILTTHYIEEAEEIADRIGVINNGELLLVEDKNELMQKLGSKELIIEIRQPISNIPDSLGEYNLQLSGNGTHLTYSYDVKSERTGITSLLQSVNHAGLQLKDLHTSQSSLEEIFVNLVKDSSHTISDDTPNKEALS